MKMRRACIALSSAWLLTLAQPVAAAVTAAEQRVFVDRAIATVFLPAFNNLQNSGAALHAAVAKSCQAVHAARPELAAVIEDFSSIESYRIGAMNTENRAERLYFWPDRKGTGQRQLRRLLLSPARAELNLDALQKKSVALQGLAALERILYQPARDAADCVVAQAIAANLKQITQELAADWRAGGGSAKALQEGGKASAYRDSLEALAAVLTVANSGLAYLANKKSVVLIKGLARSQALAKNAPFWRSGLTFENVRRNFASAVDLLQGSGAAEAAAVQGVLGFERSNGFAMLVAAEEALEQGDIATANNRLEAFRFVAQSVQALIAERIAPALGVVTGFNASDGD